MFLGEPNVSFKCSNVSRYPPYSTVATGAHLEFPLRYSGLPGILGQQEIRSVPKVTTLPSISLDSRAGLDTRPGP